MTSKLLRSVSLDLKKYEKRAVRKNTYRTARHTALKTVSTLECLITIIGVNNSPYIQLSLEHARF